MYRFVNGLTHRERRCAAPCYGARLRHTVEYGEEAQRSGSGCSGARMPRYLRDGALADRPDPLHPQQAPQFAGGNRAGRTPEQNAHHEHRAQAETENGAHIRRNLEDDHLRGDERAPSEDHREDQPRVGAHRGRLGAVSTRTRHMPTLPNERSGPAFAGSLLRDVPSVSVYRPRRFSRIRGAARPAPATSFSFRGNRRRSGACKTPSPGLPGYSS